MTARDFTQAQFVAALERNGFGFRGVRQGATLDLAWRRIRKAAHRDFTLVDLRWQDVAGPNAPEVRDLIVSAFTRRGAVAEALQLRAMYRRKVAADRKAGLKRDSDFAASIGIPVPQFIIDHHATRRVRGV